MPATLLPDEPAPVRLMNTVWAGRSALTDDFDTLEGFRAWVAAFDPAAAAAGDGERERFRALRDALRRLAAFATGDTRPAAASAIEEVEVAVAEVNRAAALAPAWPVLELRGDGLAARAAGAGGPADRLLASFAAQGIALLTGPAALRACYGPNCVLYFTKDHPRREWCSAGCGNRARAARHYARHRGA
ncbi:ABATE domain-containing protein [Glycomyces terrestris]|uniref:ABATE domain-containing protein n=1 Tax=Glycomyces terrestris TaxID=2493553 RepID=UPI0018D54323|nr:ABATE domain-containing protein [Glycomyces terrestris]